jgi:hypothetical protein
MNNPSQPRHDEGLTQRQVAARLECAVGKVNRLVRERELTRLADGRISSASVTAYMARGGPALATPAAPPDGYTGGRTNASAYAASRTRREAATAEMAELDLKVRRGELIERATVGPAISGIFRGIRDAVLQAVREQPHRAEDAVAEAFAAKAAELGSVT